MKIPPLVRSAKLIVAEHTAMHVDNLTGAIVHDKKVDRALARMGFNPVYIDETDSDRLAEAPVVIARSHGGKKINPVLLDAFTASMVVKVWDAISDANKAKLPDIVERFTVAGTVDRFWKLVR